MASPWEQFVAAMSGAGPLATGLALAAVPVVAGIAVYIARVAVQAKIDGLTNQIDRLNGKLEDLRAAKEAASTEAVARYDELHGRYTSILATRGAVQAQLETITSAVAAIALELDARDWSVLVPAPTLVPGDHPDELVFLCASGPQGAKLRSVRVPIATSMAGNVFRSGGAKVAQPTPAGTGFSRRADEVSDYRTDETLSVCLPYRDGARGVAQFLNRRSGRFGGNDVEKALDLCRPLAVRVGDFVSEPERLADLGYSPRRNEFAATIMFIDLTGYSALFGRLDGSVINDILNEYFEMAGNIVLGHNAVIDQFIGDGALVVFSGTTDRDHGVTAVQAAREIVAGFAKLRMRWATIGYRGGDALFVRVGLSTGTVTRTEIGHRQFRRVTVIGACVNDAAAVCEGAPRGRDTVCLSEPTSTASRADVRPVAGDVFELTL